MMEFVEFKTKDHLDKPKAWEIIEPILVTRVKDESEAVKLANALLCGFTTEVRWNFRGSLQGHYHGRILN